MAEPATWDNMALVAPYGYVQPGGIAGNADTERGDIYSGPIGTRVDAPTMGYYDAAASTNYQTVLRTPSGQGINIMHIDAIPFADGALVAAGAEVGTITAATGNYWSTRGHRQQYFSEFPDAAHGIVEVGLYDNPRDAGGRNSGYEDPAGMLSGFTGPQGSAPGISPTQPIDSTAPALAPGQKDPNGKHGLPTPGGVADAVGSNVGGFFGGIGAGIGGTAGKIVSGALQGASRLGLVALFALLAVGILFLMFKSLLIPGMKGA